MKRTIAAGLWLAPFLLAAAPAGGQTITVAAPWEIAGPDPSVAGFAFQRMEVAENLVDADLNGNLRPGLATEWAVSDDGLTWTFGVREGVTFHDGTALTAAAAATSLERARQNPGVPEAAPIERFAAQGNDVVATLSEPFAALPALLVHSSSIILAPSSFAEDGSVVAAIGTGPYRVTELAPPQSMSLAAYEGYWGEPPQIQEANYLAAGRAETRALLAESRDAALVVNLDPPGLARLSAVDGIETHAVPIPRVVMIKANAAHPLLAEPEARQALSLAIDRQGIAAGLLRAPETTATQLFPKGLGAWHVAELDPLTRDTDRARALLAGLGYEEGADGVLERDGTRFSLSLRTFPDRPELPLIAAALQDQWRQIGVELDVSVGSFSEIPAGHTDGSLELALYARNYGLTPDPIGAVLTDYGAGGGDWGAMNWDRPDVAEALGAIAATGDPEVRAPKIAEVAAALQNDLPVIPIVWYRQTAAVDQRLKGIEIDPLERTYGIAGARWQE